MAKQKKPKSSIKKVKVFAPVSATTKPVDIQINYNKIKNRLGIFIAFFSFVLYAQSITFNYTFDDVYITENNLIKKGLSAIPILIKTDQTFGLNDENKRVVTYRPLPMIMHTLEWQLFPDNPHFYHLINILLYSLSCWLLFLLLCKLFENRKNNKLCGEHLNLILPFICSLLYAVHPIHTEVVDSIKSQDEIFCFLFAIISIFLFIKAEEKKSVFKTALAIVFYSLSLFSKETGIACLIIIPLTLFVFSNIKPKKILYITLALAVLSGVFFLLRSKALELITQNRIENLHSVYLNTLWAAPDFITQKATAVYILLKYILLLIFPCNLSFDYSFAQIPIQQISSPSVLFGMLLYFTIGIYAIIRIRKKDLFAFAILFYLVTLAPISNIFLMINCTMADRFMYMPSLGFCMLLSLLMIKLTKAELNKSKFKTVMQLFKTNALLFVVVFIIAGLYSFRTIKRNPDWKDRTALYGHDIKIVPNNAKAHFFYGDALFYIDYPKEKNKEKKNIIINNVISEFKKAISIIQIPDAYAHLGAAYLIKWDYKNAIINYEAAIHLLHLRTSAYIYCDLGLAYTKTGQYNKAISILDSSIKYYPNYPDAYLKKSYTYLTFGKNEEAIVESDKLLKIDANNVTAYENKGCGYLNLKQYEKAIENLNYALRLDSTNTNCMEDIRMAYQRLGDTIKAKQYFYKENRLRKKIQQ